jgi:hypothetical protein
MSEFWFWHFCGMPKRRVRLANAQHACELVARSIEFCSPVRSREFGNPCSNPRAYEPASIGCISLRPSRARSFTA